MTLYVGETMLRECMVEMLRMHAPSVTDVRLARLPGPFRPRNWTIEWINVLAEDYGCARDAADEQEAMDHWIMIPDRHPLDGQVYGREVARTWMPGPDE